MKKTEFMEGIYILQNAYNKQLSKEQLKLYYENLKKLDQETFLANINEIVKTHTYMPNIAQILALNSPRKQFLNYEQREYKNINFNKFYANV